METPDTSDTALLSVNAAILNTFIQLAKSEGSIPLVVYFPENNAELEGPANPLSKGRQVLHAAGVPYTDQTPCVQALPSAERFVGGRWHYTSQTNARVAHCLSNVVREALTVPAS